MYAAAFVTTASILGLASDKINEVTPLWALLIGVGGAAIPVTIAAFFNRKKADVDVSKAITEASVELLNQYRQRDLELEARLVKAELAATTALLAEARCVERLTNLEAKVASMATGETTTTVLTQVTHP